MKATTFSLALILVGTTGVLADDMKMPVNASQLEWAQAPNFVPEGAQIAVGRSIKGWAICDPV